MAISDKETHRQAVRDALESGYRDREWLRTHPEIRRQYAGEWIVVADGRIAAHSPDGQVVAQAASIERCPGSSLHYIPTEQEREAVRII